jgi:hypothetical protein
MLPSFNPTANSSLESNKQHHSAASQRRLHEWHFDIRHLSAAP